MDCSEVVMSFGKHKGWTLGQLPDDYLAWLVSGKCDYVEPGGWAYKSGLRNSIDEEVLRRNAASDDAEDDEAEAAYEREHAGTWAQYGKDFHRPASTRPPPRERWQYDGSARPDNTRQAYEEAERRRKADFSATRANAPTEQCTRCHDTGYVSGFGMKATCNCERGLLHKVRDLETTMNEERVKRLQVENDLRLERSQTAYWRGKASDATNTHTQDKSREAEPAVPRIRSSVTRTSCMEILTAARRGYAKSLHRDKLIHDILQAHRKEFGLEVKDAVPPSVVEEAERKVAKQQERLMVLNASLDFLEKCAQTLRNE